MKEKNLYSIRENPWFASTIVLLIVIIFLFVYLAPNPTPKEDINLCYSIQGTPAWIIEGEVKGYGYQGNLSVDRLIGERVSFYYNINCGLCLHQIASFDNWSKYRDSGLTRRCN